jgi:hypothetical protein
MGSHLTKGLCVLFVTRQKDESAAITENIQNLSNESAGLRLKKNNPSSAAR